jgi:ABC-type antimicrobial peptide transport system permease subunit
VAGTLLSVLGAIYPAIVAARMEPVAALRSDN